jgi:hypothetical protein
MFTETGPNGGWIDFSGNTCSAGTQRIVPQSMSQDFGERQLTEFGKLAPLGEQTGTSKTVQIGVGFGGGPEFDL